MRSLECVDERLLHDGVRTMVRVEVGVAAAGRRRPPPAADADAEAASAAAAAAAAAPPVDDAADDDDEEAAAAAAAEAPTPRGSRSTSSKKCAWHSREAKST